MSVDSIVIAEVWRGEVLECVHRGTAVVCRPDGEIIAAWGNPSRTILPRSSCKMLQALPLVESGTAKDFGLKDTHLALACASHQGAEVHTSLAGSWLKDLGLGENSLRCGPQIPNDREARHALRACGRDPDQTYNNCSGKHCGFLTRGKALGAGSEYIESDHPVQVEIRQTMSELAGEDLRDFAIDGCSAPNFTMTMAGFATSLARFARPSEALTGNRAKAVLRLRTAMADHPVLVAGHGRACTRLIEAMANGSVVKTGAEGVFAGVLPDQGIGIAVKCDDGSQRGAEAAIAALLARFGVLGRDDPVYRSLADTPILNRRGIAHGHLRAAEVLLS